MPELKMAKKPCWRLCVHTNYRTEHMSVYRDNTLGVQKEAVVPYRNGKPCNGKTYYSIDGDKREFRSEEELMAALTAKGAAKC
jgi:hypothetical protein